MRNQCFDPGFLFDFYSNRGSTATPSGHSNVSWCGLGKFLARNGEVHFLSFFQLWSPIEQKLEERESNFWNRRRVSNVVFKLIENSAYVDALRREVASNMRTFFEMDNCKCPSLTHRTTQSHQIFMFAKQMGVLLDHQVLSCSLYNWERYCTLNFEKSQKNCQSLGSPNLS